ncbi:C4-dicarboxylate transporter DctA [Pseudonocardia sp. C8]|uniref:C4-dicarboxylate transporter DctA n=1 Tax=Pseudonocardia sp. C8 TaxID=2762759 RepID=UPI0016431A44|nr:C4-dicarboxylate transporter DctA [Pseudonocardia sp. C8]MBC3191008.1 C4-dicarboxylate transporter DctA [Pseudonocardia sp. C8]
MSIPEGSTGRKKQPFYRSLFFQVIAGLILGLVVGFLWPAFGSALKPLGDGFINLIKMIVAPLVFCVVVTGIAGTSDMAALRRIGVKALIYFEVVTTIALVLGLVIAEVFAPGRGMHIDPRTLDAGAVEEKTGGAELSAGQFILDIIPVSVVDSFAQNNLLQVLLFSLISGVALVALGDRGKPFMTLLQSFQELIFQIVGYVMKLAPLATFGVAAFTVGEYGVDSLLGFGKMIGTFYVAVAAFLVFLAVLVRLTVGVGLFRVVNYVREEVALAAFTGSSEAVLPQLTEKLERAGCSRSVVGIVLPAGYSFNLDGASLFLTASVVFLAQALDVDLTLTQQVTIILVAIVTSKGMAGVAGSAFVALTATLGVVGGIPAAAAALILGPDRIIGKGRTATNTIGYVIATLVIARWEKQLDREQLRKALSRRPQPEQAVQPDSGTPATADVASSSDR